MTNVMLDPKVPTVPTAPTATRAAVLDDAHVGDIKGALGTIRLDDTTPRSGLSARLKTLLAIVGPGLIVMVGDNDAGAFSTYGQAGQNYGTQLLWTLLMLVPVLYVNQEMVLRLGAVTGVGHARLILERFGKFWGAFSVIDLFLLLSHAWLSFRSPASLKDAVICLFLEDAVTRGSATGEQRIGHSSRAVGEDVG